MVKQSLKVSPAKKVYQPRYPSYLDKNPLLYPETRPYPFSHKILKWASTGGLASIMFFGTGNLYGQKKVPPVPYNTFPLENAKVPYRPVMFGTGMPSRVSSDDAIKIIRKAFTESGIDLENDVWLDKNNVGVVLDGYSHQDEIGFIFMDYTNMDHSFQDRSHMSKRMKNVYDLSSNPQKKFSDDKQEYFESMKAQYDQFLKDKETMVHNWANYGRTQNHKDCAPILEKVKTEDEFNAIYIQYDLANIDRYVANKNHLLQDLESYILSRFYDPIEKLILFRYARSFRNISLEMSDIVSTRLQEMKSLKDDNEFIEQLNDFQKLLKYNNNSTSLNKDKAYQNIKLKIMQSHPVSAWMDNLDALDKYHDKHFISLKEAKKIDKKNKKGKQFIAPISSRDPLMIYRPPYSQVPEEINEERKSLQKEFDMRNGMTQEVKAEKRKEKRIISDKYDWSEMNKLPETERDSLRQIRQEKLKAINEKYKAMELLTEEEREAFKVRFDANYEKQNKWRKEQEELSKMQTLQKLEEQVKLYIKWAKSQMGG